MLEYTCGSESGLEHGRRSVEIAEKLDNEASRSAAYAALGLANLVEGQPTAARDARRCGKPSTSTARSALPATPSGSRESSTHEVLVEPSRIPGRPRVRSGDRESATRSPRRHRARTQSMN